MSVAISVSKGRFTAFVDAADAAEVNAYQWWVMERGRTQYAQSSMRDANGRRYIVYMHRLVMGASPDQCVDHVDGDGLNNCRSNLRLATLEQNSANNRKHRIGLSRFKGVSINGAGRYFAQIKCSLFNDSTWQIGVFDTEQDAAVAYDAVARLIYGDFARVNFPRKNEQCALPLRFRRAA